jgi:hypothetical protein
MAPRRSDFKTRKEYRWAKKVENRERIANASVPGAFIVSCAVWLAIVIVGSLIGGGAGGAIGVFVGIPAAIIFHRKFGATINKVWNTKETAEKQRQNR